MPKAIRTFKNVQARVCRTADGTWLSGWVIYLGQEEARIRLEPYAALERDERLVVECYGDGTRVRFSGRLVGQTVHEVAISVSGSMLFEPSRDAVRFLIEKATGTLRIDDQEAGFVARDVSPQGLGGFAECAYAPGTTLHLSLETDAGTFEAKVGVVYCQPEGGGSDRFRLGLGILESSRLDIAMWHRLLEECAADGVEERQGSLDDRARCGV